MESKRTARPIIGISVDVSENSSYKNRQKYDVSADYALSIAKAGGTPLLLPAITEAIPAHLALCDGFVLTGGSDPDMTPFGVPTHPQADVMHPARQAYEVGLLCALREKEPQKPVLGVCLGMQLMGLVAGGKMNQHLADTLSTHAMHKNAGHRVVFSSASRFLQCGSEAEVHSNHHQAIEDAGDLTVIGRSDDQIIEAICDPSRCWYVGVQWHPERTEQLPVGQHIFEQLVRVATPTRTSYNGTVWKAVLVSCSIVALSVFCFKRK
eukprot:gb/GEZN01011523.1/.p1 GENE.gb/GEZN01011523.1/~~gb/GEZN01011523.1/.p1  ORF type:complete len:280 (+),score=21.82 gb/GEZN01011523.1/:44-841(+)